MPGPKALLLGVLLGILSSALAWPVSTLLSYRSTLYTALWGPLWEEAVKTGSALVGGAPLVLVHATFGLVEGIWEWTRGERRAAWGAAFGHALFGTAAGLSLKFFGSPLGAWGTGAVLHVGWNLLFCRLHRPGRP